MNIRSLPPQFYEFDWNQRTIGRSSACVFEMTRAGSGNLFAKSMPCSDCEEIQAEAAKLQWLERQKLPAAKVITQVKHNDHFWLITKALPGVNGIESNAEPQKMVSEIAKALRLLHAINIGQCPFDEQLENKLNRALFNVENNKVDSSDFDTDHMEFSATGLLKCAFEKRPGDENLVVTHGDASLPNFIFDKGSFSGFVDCSRLGVADLHQDVAIAARSIAHNLGAKWVEGFTEEYGIDNIDSEKLRYYRLLDEFF